MKEQIYGWFRRCRDHRGMSHAGRKISGKPFRFAALRNWARSSVREAVKRANLDPKQVDECIMGNVVSAGLGQNPARQAAIFGGLPPEVGAMTINKVCGSGLKAVALAAQAIRPGTVPSSSRADGVDDQRSVSSAASAKRIPARQRQRSSIPWCTTDCGTSTTTTTWDDRRERCGKIWHHARRAG